MSKEPEVQKQRNFRQCTIINADALEFFRKQKSKLDYFPRFEELQQRELESTITLLELLETFAKEQGIPFEFVTISANQFNTGFNKKDFKEINVYFPNLNSVSYLKDVINLFDAEQPRSNFFYLYAKMENRNYQRQAEHCLSCRFVLAKEFQGISSLL